MDEIDTCIISWLLQMTLIKNVSFRHFQTAFRNCQGAYAVRENMENIVNMEKSWKNGKNLPRSRKSQGNSFSANLRCLNFEVFWASMPPDPLKVFGPAANIYIGSWKSQ